MLCASSATRRAISSTVVPPSRRSSERRSWTAAIDWILLIASRISVAHGASSTLSAVAMRAGRPRSAGCSGPGGAFPGQGWTGSAGCAPRPGRAGRSRSPSPRNRKTPAGCQGCRHPVSVLSAEPEAEGSNCLPGPCARAGKRGVASPSTNVIERLSVVPVRDHVGNEAVPLAHVDQLRELVQPDAR